MFWYLKECGQNDLKGCRGKSGPKSAVLNTGLLFEIDQEQGILKNACFSGNGGVVWVVSTQTTIATGKVLLFCSWRNVNKTTFQGARVDLAPKVHS